MGALTSGPWAGLELSGVNRAVRSGSRQSAGPGKLGGFASEPAGSPDLLVQARSEAGCTWRASSMVRGNERAELLLEAG